MPARIQAQKEEMSKPKEVLPIVEVEWIDSVRDGGWGKRTRYEAEAVVMKCRSAGYLLKANRQIVCIIQSLDEQKDGNATDSITIPRSCVRSITKMTRLNGSNPK